MATRQVNGRTIWHEHAGHGPNLLLVHGFPLDHQIFDAVIDPLSSVATVHVIDLPGFGKSTGREPFTIESLADCVHTLMQGLGALPCVLCGLSMGGYVSQAFAKKYAADLSALVLVDTRAEADNTAAKEGRDKMIALVRKGGTELVIDAMLPRLIAPDSSAEVVEKLKSIMLGCPPLTIEHALAAIRDREDYTGMLEKLSIPVDVVVGEMDVISPVAVAQEIVRHCREGNLTVIPEAGHLAPLEKPGEVAAAIVRSMRRRRN